MNQPKHSYISPIDNIRNSYFSLSSTQKKIADLILDQAETVCFMRLEDISKKVGVTNVTVIRFVKKLGYESFGSFKKDLQNYIQNHVVPKRIVKSEVNDFRDSSVDDIIHKVIQNEFDLIKTMYDGMSLDVLYETALCIKNAHKIYIVGTGLNTSVAQILLTRLKYLSLDAQIIHDDNPTLLPYTLINIGKDDVFIIFSFPNYKNFAINIAKCARDMGCHTICITDSPTSPIAYYAEKLLLCPTSSLIYYNSMTTPTSLVTLLSSILAVCIKKDEKVQERLNHISSYFNE